MKTAASTRDQIDGRSIVIWVVIAGSSWSCDDGGEGHDGLGVLMEVACVRFAMLQAVARSKTCGSCGAPTGHGRVWA